MKFFDGFKKEDITPKNVVTGVVQPFPPNSFLKKTIEKARNEFKSLSFKFV